MKGRTSRCFLSIGASLAALVAMETSYADPGPRGFYGKDFAAAPQVSHEPLHGEIVQRPPQLAEEVPHASSESDDDRVDPSDNVEREVRAAIQGQGEGAQRRKRDTMPATTLLLFVNSKDKQHLRSVLKKAVEVAKKNDAFLATVFQLGDYRNVPEDLAATLESFGVAIVPMLAPPEDLAISQSPAWVFQSQSGVQIVEGTTAIEQFYDSEGNFKEPANFIDQQPQSEPTQVNK